MEPLQQLKEILLTLSLAFDNFVEANFMKNPKFFNFSYLNTLKNENFTNSSSSSLSSSTSNEGSKIIKFDTTENIENSKNTRKRSWESEEISVNSSEFFIKDKAKDHHYNNNNNGGDDQEYFQVKKEKVRNQNHMKCTPNNQTEKGKRSKSLVLAQELESLHLSSSSLLFSSNQNPNYQTENNKKRLEIELENLYFEQQNRNQDNKMFCIRVLMMELEGARGIDEILQIISHHNQTNHQINNHNNNNNNNVDNINFNHWIKWTVITELLESFQFTQTTTTSIKITLQRSICLLKGLNILSSYLDWSDPEISFLLNKFMVCLLNFDKFKVILDTNVNCNNTTNSKNILAINRRLEEFMGLLKVINLFIRLPHQQTVNSFLLSRSDTYPQVIQLLESFLEITLNVFELSTILSEPEISPEFNGLHVAACYALITAKVIGLFLQDSLLVNALINHIKNTIT